MAKTRQVQWEQQKLQQMMMESDLEEDAAAGTPRSVAIATPRSFFSTPRSITARTTRSIGLDSPVSAVYSPAPVANGNMRSSPVGVQLSYTVDHGTCYSALGPVHQVSSLTLHGAQ